MRILKHTFFTVIALLFITNCSKEANDTPPEEGIFKVVVEVPEIPEDYSITASSGTSKMIPVTYVEKDTSQTFTISFHLTERTHTIVSDGKTNNFGIGVLGFVHPSQSKKVLPISFKFYFNNKKLIDTVVNHDTGIDMYQYTLRYYTFEDPKFKILMDEYIDY